MARAEEDRETLGMISETREKLAGRARDRWNVRKLGGTGGEAIKRNNKKEKDVEEEKGEGRERSEADERLVKLLGSAPNAASFETSDPVSSASRRSGARASAFLRGIFGRLDTPWIAYEKSTPAVRERELVTADEIRNTRNRFHLYIGWDSRNYRLKQFVIYRYLVLYRKDVWSEIYRI